MGLDAADHLGRPVRRGIAGRADHREPQRVEDGGAEPPVTEGEGAHGVAVVGVAEGEEPVVARLAAIDPVLECNLQRLLDGDGAVGSEQHVRILHRHHGGERLGELDRGTTAVPEQRRVGHPAQLIDDGRVELWDVVAESGHPQRGDAVEVPLPVDVDQLPALGTVHDHRSVAGVGSHLGEPVPDHGCVPCHPRVGRGGGGHRAGHPVSLADEREPVEPGADGAPTASGHLPPRSGPTLCR